MMHTCNTHCRICGTELIVGQNWTQKRKDHKMYICSACELKEGRNRHMRVNGKYISKHHPLHKPGNYKSFGDAAFSALEKDKKVKEGYIYVITNLAWPEWVKIGMAVDADDRCNGYQTSSPFRDYSLEHVVVSNNRRVSEAQAHKAAAKIAEEQRGEWFKISIEQAKDVLNKLSVNLEKAA